MCNTAIKFGWRSLNNWRSYCTLKTLFNSNYTSIYFTDYLFIYFWLHWLVNCSLGHNELSVTIALTTYQLIWPDTQQGVVSSDVNRTGRVNAGFCQVCVVCCHYSIIVNYLIFFCLLFIMIKCRQCAFFHAIIIPVYAINAFFPATDFFWFGFVLC